MKKHPTFSRNLRPEYQFILLCSRKCLTPEAARTISELICEGLDWRCVVKTAVTHKVAPLLYKNLTAFNAPGLPQEWMEILRKHYERNARRNIYLAAQLVLLLEALRAENIPAIPYKGPVLAALAYGDLTLREFDDLDLMIPHQHIANAFRRMIADGFKAEITAAAGQSAGQVVPGQYSFQKDGGRCHVELHTERTLRYYPKRLDIAELVSQSSSIPLAGHMVPSLAPESLLMVLGVHGSKHFWDRLTWICDIAELLQLQGGLQWDLAIEQARRFECERMVLLGSALANELLGVQLPGPIAARLSELPEIHSISRRLASNLFSDTPNVPGVAERILVRVQTSQSVVQGLRYCYDLAMIPTEEDLEWASWASGVAPVYRLLRPLRLLRKYGTGLFHRHSADRLQ